VLYTLMALPWVGLSLLSIGNGMEWMSQGMLIIEANTRASTSWLSS